MMWSLRLEVSTTFAFLRLACVFATDAQILMYNVVDSLGGFYDFCLLPFCASLGFLPRMHEFSMYDVVASLVFFATNFRIFSYAFRDFLFSLPSISGAFSFAYCLMPNAYCLFPLPSSLTAV